MCRTANGWDANGFGQLKDGRGNICPVTIIMPTLAAMCKYDSEEELTEDELVEKFMDLLNTKITEAAEQLEERFEWICSQDESAAKFMYENNTMAGYVPEEGIRSALKHGTLAVGQIGLAETLQILIGCDHTTKKGLDLAKRIEKLFADRCKELKKVEHFDEKGNKYYLNYGVYYTPECRM